MVKVIIEPASYDNLSRAIAKVFEIFPLDLHGKKVLIKPNVLRASYPEEGIVTHPAVLHAIVQEVELMKPASIVVGDNPGIFSYGANEASFKQTGLMEAARGYYRNIGLECLQVDFYSEYAPSVSISKAVLDADVVISVPKFKTHGLTVITGAIKNCYGYLPGAQKAALHRKAGSPHRFHEVIVDVFRLRVPDLFIVDAVVGMEGNGPASPHLRDIGLVIASDNAVSLDAVIATMMGCDPNLLPFLNRAESLGLGNCDLSEVDIIGELKAIKDFKLPPLGGEAVSGNKEIQSAIRAKTKLKPHLDPVLCTGCGTCAEHCAVSALSMQDGIPVVDANSCIICFCCQEICPEKAITLN